MTLDRARTPPLVWRAQVLEDGRVTTYLVGDDDLDVYEMTDENEAVLVSEGSVPPASFDPWPPVDAFGVIELTSLVGEGRPPMEVAVIDRSGHLLALREPTTADPVVRALGRSPFVLAEPGDARSIRLGWAGGVCDSRVTVTVDSLDSILIDGGPQPPCDSMGIGREVILTFDQTLDPSLIDLGYKETRTPEETPIPESSLPPGGPLEPSGGSAIPAPISVAEALEIRAQPDDDRRIAVRGWLWRDPTIYDCYVPPSPPPLLESGCRGPHDRLLADATQPDGPGFTLAFPPWVEGIGAPFGEPVEVVAVGRFDHPLADECTPSARDACAEVFVVEAVMRFGRRSSSRIHVAG